MTTEAKQNLKLDETDVCGSMDKFVEWLSSRPQKHFFLRRMSEYCAEKLQAEARKDVRALKHLRQLTNMAVAIERELLDDHI